MAEKSIGDSRQYRSGMIAFFLSGICSISAGIIVSMLRDSFQLSYSFSGTLVSLMSIGNMVSLLVSGILPGRIGEKATTLLLTFGYFLGYTLMALTGNSAVLIIAFLLAGLAKGCTANKSTVLVGSNSGDRAKSLTLMNAWYALGALMCPFLISGAGSVSRVLPMVGVGIVGLGIWIVFLFSGLPEKPSAVSRNKGASGNSFLKSGIFWILTLLLFCQNAAEYTVNGWVVTYYKSEQILTGSLASYTVTVQWALTLAARLLLAFTFKINRPYKALTVMGIGLTVTYAIMLRMNTAVPALIALGLFSFSIAGVYPLAIACIGEMMNSASVGVMLSIAGVGGIAFPWLVGIMADAAGLRSGMAVNLIPCAGIIVLPLVISKIAHSRNAASGIG